jgi:hypothetical protein
VDLPPGSCDAGSKRGLSSIDLEKWNRGDGCKLCPCVNVTVLVAEAVNVKAAWIIAGVV